MKKKILILFYGISAYLGLIRLFYWKNRRKQLVIAYHNVIPDFLFDDTYHLGVSHKESIFAKQVQLIYRRFVRNKKQYDRKRVLITFDDGYKNQIEIAARILNQYKLCGIFFITFESVIENKSLIIDNVMKWVSYVPTNAYKIGNELISMTDANRNEIANKLYKNLLQDYTLWDSIETQLNNAFPFSELAIHPELARLRFKPLSIEELHSLMKQGHLLGAHGWSHKPLGILPVEMQEKDFVACKSFSQKYCNTELYSYPFGNIFEVTPVTTKLCAKMGYSAAYMNIPNQPAWKNVNNNYVLSRISLPNEDNKYLLDAKLSGFEFFCKNLVKKLTFRQLRAALYDESYY